MVGDDEVDGAVAEGLPEGFAVGAAADGRRALEEGGAVGDVFGGEVEVVGAGFDGDGKAFGAGGVEHGEGVRGGEVDDVEAEAVLAAEVGSSADGVELGFVGARGEVGGVLAPVGVAGELRVAASMGSASSAWTSSGRPDAAMAGGRAPSCSRSIMVKPSQPG